MQLRKLGWTLGALGAVTVLSISAMAQAPKAGAQSGRRANAANREARQNERNAALLLEVPVSAIDKIAGLTSDQKTKITDIQEKFKTEAKALRPARGAQPDPANRQKLRDLSATYSKQIVDLLTPEQKQKLTAAAQKFAGLRSAGIPIQAAVELNLTDDQKTKIAAIVKDARTQLQAVPQADRRTKGREIMQAAREKVMALLTPDQKAVIEKYARQRGQGARANRRNTPAAK